MRIGFLHAWKDSAENQAFETLAIAARRIGQTLIHCTNSEDLDRAGLDFVLAASVSQPKLSDVPTYAVLHQPRDNYLAHRGYFENLLTYDGYLVVADSVARFVGDLLFSANNDVGFGFYYNTCHAQEAPTDLAGLIARDALRVTYFGTNWDRRRQGLFKRLADSGLAQIFGPEQAWAHINRRAYAGSVPFDGESVQQKYRENGIGLCILSEGHFAEDVISNRIFETVSVGAVAVCCDTPWIRRYFGNSVYYIDQLKRDDLLAADILACYERIRAHPEEAMARAASAKRIFEEQFSAEVMLGNAVEYHEHVQQRRRAAIERISAGIEPFISVVICCTGRPRENAVRTLRSVLRQTVGRFDLILVCGEDAGTPECDPADTARMAGIKVIRPPAGAASNGLWTGLRAVSGDYFCILQAGDWLFSNHFEAILERRSAAGGPSFLGYSGNILEAAEAWLIDHDVNENRKLAGPAVPGETNWPDLGHRLVAGCFVASRDLLSPRLLTDPKMQDGADAYLIMSLLAEVVPSYSNKATYIHSDIGDDGANGVKLADDAIRLACRLGGCARLQAPHADLWPLLTELWARRVEAEAEVSGFPNGEGRSLIRPAGFVPSMVDPAERVLVASGFVVEPSSFSPGSVVIDASAGNITVAVPERPWEYGAQLVLPAVAPGSGELVIIMQLKVLFGAVGVGLLKERTNEFSFQRSLASTGRTIELHVPVYERSQMGALVVRNWSRGGKARVEIGSIRMFVLADDAAPWAQMVSESAPPLMKEPSAVCWGSRRDVTDQMLAGRAGHKAAGAIAARMFTAGHVCYGPYCQLAAGRYRVEVGLVWPAGIRLIFNRLAGTHAGIVEVLSVASGWEAGSVRFVRGAPRAAVEFEVAPERTDAQLEFRVASLGGPSFAVNFVHVLRMD